MKSLSSPARATASAAAALRPQAPASRRRRPARDAAVDAVHQPQPSAASRVENHAEALNALGGSPRDPFALCIGGLRVHLAPGVLEALRNEASG